MKSLPAAPVGSNSVLGHCVTHNASTTDARGAAVSQVANKQHAGSLICSEWTCNCDSALLRIVSLKVCFASDPVKMSLYPQKHVLPHFDKTVQLILLWLQCDLRSTFAHKLLIPGALEQWINQQREYFCLQIKEESKTWPLFFFPPSLWAAEAELASQMSAQCFWCSWGILWTDFKKQTHYAALAQENDVRGSEFCSHRGPFLTI